MADDDTSDADAALGTCCFIILVIIGIIVIRKWINRPISNREMRKFMTNQTKQTNIMVQQNSRQTVPPYYQPPPTPYYPPANQPIKETKQEIHHHYAPQYDQSRTETVTDSVYYKKDSADQVAARTSKIYCSYCRSPVKGNWKACPECGKRL